MGRTVVRTSFVGVAALVALLLFVLASNPQTAMGGPEDVPDRPTGLTGDVYYDRVELRWDDPGDDRITGYKILRLTRGVDKLGNFHTHVEDTGSAETSYTDRDVTAETRYVYRIHALNGDDESPRSTFFNANTPEVTDPPARPAGLTGEASRDRVDLRWDDPEDNNITGYQVLRGNRVDGEDTDFQVLVADTGSRQTSYTDEDVEEGASYAYRIRARNVVGLSPESADYNADTPALSPPARPTGLTGTASYDRVELRWDDPGDGNITGYQVLRGNRVDGEETAFQVLVDDTASAQTSYTDEDVGPDNRYAYRVRARNVIGLSPESADYNADTPALSLPAAPEVFAAHVFSADSVVVEWTSDAAAGSITCYRILRGADADSLAEIEDDTGLGNADAVGAWWQDTTAPAGRTVFYAVQARNAAGLSPLSNAFEAVIPGEPAPDPDLPAAPDLLAAAKHQGQVLLGWEQVPADKSITGYRILRGDSEDSLTELVADTGTTDTTYADADPPDGGTVWYAVQARNANGLGPRSNARAAEEPVVNRQATPPAAPWLMATAATPDGVTLQWGQDPPDDSITGYRILRGDSEDTLAEIVADTGNTDTSYTDTTAPAGQTVHYAVQARNANGLSEQSNTRSVTTPAAEEPLVSQPQEEAQVLMDYITSPPACSTTSCTGEANFGGFWTIRSGESIAHPFRTGSGGDIRLLSVEVHLGGTTAIDDSLLSDFEASLRSHAPGGDFGTPGEQVYALTPSSVSGTVMTLTAPADAEPLNPQTVYWVVIKANATLSRVIPLVDKTDADFIDHASTESAWSLPGTVHTRVSDTSAWESEDSTAGNQTGLVMRMHGVFLSDSVDIPDAALLMELVLVSNLDPTAVDAIAIGAGSEAGQAFTTGNRPAGYRLTSVRISMRRFGTQTPAGVTVQLREGGRSNPTGTVLHTFDNPPGLFTTAPGTMQPYVFTTTEPPHLEPNTTYFIRVLVSSGAGRILGTADHSEDDDSLDNWSIANRSRQFNPVLNTWLDAIGVFEMELRGTRECAARDGADPSTPVNIPDPALRRAVLAALGKSDGETVTRADMASITTLNAEWRSIADMEGLQYATGLRDLRLDNNRITSTIDFCGLTGLEQLWLRNNRIGGTVDLLEQTSLRTIQLQNNRITALELPSSLDRLYTLDASDNRIASIDLPWAPDIFYLDLTGNRLTSIDLSRLGGTMENPRAGIIGSFRVQLGANRLTSVNFGGSAGQITTLNLDRNRFTSLSLPNMGALVYLNAGNNHDLTSFSIGNGSDDLETLLLHACDLSSLNVSGLADLRYINVEFNGTVTVTGAHADATVVKDD